MLLGSGTAVKGLSPGSDEDGSTIGPLMGGVPLPPLSKGGSFGNRLLTGGIAPANGVVAGSLTSVGWEPFPKMGTEAEPRLGT